MGNLFSSDLGLLKYEHWMPGEDPTFYIPASMNLTFSQRAQLEASGLRQGEPFILTNDGALTKPTSKTFSLRGIKSAFSIRKGSLLLFEEAPGSFSLEFAYYTEEAVILEIHACAVDGSSSKHIKLKQSGMKWGPFRLNSNHHKSTSKAGQEPTIQPTKHGANINHSYKLVDVTDTEDTECRPDHTSNDPTTPVSPTNISVDASADDIVHYTKWSSRRFQHKHLVSPLIPITLPHLTSLTTPAGNSGVFDMVIIVTSTEHVAARMQRKNSINRNNGNQGTTANNNTNDTATPTTRTSLPTTVSTSQTNTVNNPPKTYATWLARRSPRKVLPSRIPSLHNITPTTHIRNSNVSNNNHAYEGIPPIDLAENPHAESYQQQHSTIIDMNVEENIFSNMDASPVAPAQGNSPSKSNNGAKVRVNNSGGVEREAFFFRVNQDSYNKRHTNNLKSSTITQDPAGAKDNATAAAGAKEKTTRSHRSRGQSADVEGSESMVPMEKVITNSASEPVFEEIAHTRVAENVTVNGQNTGTMRTPSSTRGIHHKHRSSIFMRSKGISLDLSMQLFQVATGVYTRLTIYGMENFLAPTGSTTDNRATIDNVGSHGATLPNRAAAIPVAETDNGAECIICLTNKQNTIMFPCRHLCVCAECASILATHNTMGNNHDHQSEAQEKKCPVCRKPVVLMFQLKD